MIKLVIFDLDGTLAESKQALGSEMAEWLCRLLAVLPVAVISGGAWPQYERQLLANLPSGEHLRRLSLLPTSGTRFLRYEGAQGNASWKELYAQDFTADEKARIIAALTRVFDASPHKPARHWGEVIEDRGSQITLSALGQQAPLPEKHSWDPDFAKRRAMKALLAPILPEFSIGMGGASSLDVTRPGIDKAYGIARLEEIVGIAAADMMFVGDALFEGGNDYPARRTGARCIQVAGPAETQKVIEAVLACHGAG